MSDTDSFIDEVTEEVRRDRMFLLLKRWGWVGALAVVAIVGGAAYNEYSKAQVRSQAEQLGDSIIAALNENETAVQAEKLSQVDASSSGGDAILKMLTASAQAGSDQTDAAVQSLDAVAANGELPQIYRDIASFKSLTLQTETLAVEDLRQRFEALAQPGAPLRLLAEEQLALIDIAHGEAEAAMTRLQALIQDAEASTDLQQRAAQLIVALGGTPEQAPGQRG
ncbi:hypothetical protein Q5Y75_01340 [Ruegeria sp. 2205SS24-7]|uniref:hypothetical protein n=1 Tax=Ruegeria discodermiae TaxID=3064389 RepID=UPI0027415677|nr:hypothetical protein [Ruegeria sp. 2205SS24-7]MDP5215852.1 hypothetical protein [Ruegeria sp. 2205SS24-7]